MRFRIVRDGVKRYQYGEIDILGQFGTMGQKAILLPIICASNIRKKYDIALSICVMVPFVAPTTPFLPSRDEMLVH